MANTYSTLTELFTAIANAIRAKTGSTATIVADNFPAEIAAIEGGSENALFLEEKTATMPTTANWRSVAQGNDMFVAVVYNSNIAAYSNDGATWTQTTLPATANWRKVCFGNGTFVAIAYGTDTVAYSTDGISWSSTTIPTTGNWVDVCYGNGKFVTVASDGVIALSPDGVTWMNTSADGGSWSSIVYGNDMFMIAGVNSGYSASCMTSTNGMSWTAGGYAEEFVDLTFGNDMFIAAPSSGSVYYSTDGASWSTSNSPYMGYNVLTFGNGRFVAQCEEPYEYTQHYIYSDNGTDWTTVSAPASVSDICYGEGKFVAVKSATSNVYHSTDATSWTNTTTAILNASGEDVTATVLAALGY